MKISIRCFALAAFAFVAACGAQDPAEVDAILDDAESDLAELKERVANIGAGQDNERARFYKRYMFNGCNIRCQGDSGETMC